MEEAVCPCELRSKVVLMLYSCALTPFSTMSKLKTSSKPGVRGESQLLHNHTVTLPAYGHWSHCFITLSLSHSGRFFLQQCHQWLAHKSYLKNMLKKTDNWRNFLNKCIFILFFSFSFLVLVLVQCIHIADFDVGSSPPKVSWTGSSTSSASWTCICDLGSQNSRNPSFHEVNHVNTRSYHV